MPVVEGQKVDGTRGCQDFRIEFKRSDRGSLTNAAELVLVSQTCDVVAHRSWVGVSAKDIQEVGDHSGDTRSSHRCSRENLVPSIRPSRSNVGPRGEYINYRSEVGVRGPVVIDIRCTDGDCLGDPGWAGALGVLIRVTLSDCQYKRARKKVTSTYSSHSAMDTISDDLQTS